MTVGVLEGVTKPLGVGRRFPVEVGGEEGEALGGVAEIRGVGVRVEPSSIEDEGVAVSVGESMGLTVPLTLVVPMRGESEGEMEAVGLPERTPDRDTVKIEVTLTEVVEERVEEV